MKSMLKDSGNQSIFWSAFGSFWAMYTLQEWLAIIGIIVGIISGLVNMCSKYNEGRRAEEMHNLKMERLKKGLKDE